MLFQGQAFGDSVGGLLFDGGSGSLGLGRAVNGPSAAMAPANDPIAQAFPANGPLTWGCGGGYNGETSSMAPSVADGIPTRPPPGIGIVKAPPPSRPPLGAPLGPMGCEHAHVPHPDPAAEACAQAWGCAPPSVPALGFGLGPWASAFPSMLGALAPTEAPAGNPWSKPFDARAPAIPHRGFQQAPLPQMSLPQRPPDDANPQQPFSVFGGGLAYFAGPQQASVQEQLVGRGGFEGSYGYAPEAPQGLVTDPSEYHRRLQGIPVPGKRCPQTVLVDSDLRREYQIQKTCLLMASKDLHVAKVAGSVPDTVQNKYFCLCLLDDETRGRSPRFCGYPTHVYKALAVNEPYAYCLRRIDCFHVSAFASVAKAVEKWLKLDANPCICALRQAFVTNEFPTVEEAPQDTASLVFVYEYLPNASTLESSHFQKPCPEMLLWAYICQLAVALRHIHSVGLAARVIEPSKILVSHRNRLHLNCVGVLDALRSDPACPMSEYQRQDLVALGRLVLALANGSLAVLADLAKAIDRAFPPAGGPFSPELKGLVMMLLTKPAQRQAYPSIHDVLSFIHMRTTMQFEHQLHFGDALDTELMKEVDNGRLLKIVCKLGSVCDRPVWNNDVHWATTDDRYLCKLFRDYLFHQCDEHGAPHLDMGHIVDCLNKVDVGVPEKIMLMSPCSQSVLVVSYMDVKRCIETSFAELAAAAAPLPMPARAH